MFDCKWNPVIRRQALKKKAGHTVGYWVRSSEIGRGYATEMVGAITIWALDVLGAKWVELITDEQNIGSRVVARRNGYRLVGVTCDGGQSPDGSLRNNVVYARYSPRAFTGRQHARRG